MTLQYEYFPVYTFILICLVLLSLYRGWKRGFIAKIVDLALLVATILIAWPAGQALAASYPVFSAEGFGWVSQFFNTAFWFMAVQVVLRILTAFIYKALKWIHKIKVIGFADHLAGLIVSVFTTFITLCLLVLFLELPFFTNGNTYVEDSPLRYVRTLMESNFSNILEEF